MYDKYTNKRSSLSPEEIETMSRFVTECGVFIDKCVKAGIIRVTSPPESTLPCDASNPGSDHELGGQSVSDTQKTEVSTGGNGLSDEGVSETSDTTSERIAYSLVGTINVFHSRRILVPFPSVHGSFVQSN